MGPLSRFFSKPAHFAWVSHLLIQPTADGKQYFCIPSHRFLTASSQSLQKTLFPIGWIWACRGLTVESKLVREFSLLRGREEVSSPNSMLLKDQLSRPFEHGASTNHRLETAFSNWLGIHTLEPSVGNVKILFSISGPLKPQMGNLRTGTAGWMSNYWVKFYQCLLAQNSEMSSNQLYQ